MVIKEGYYVRTEYGIAKVISGELDDVCWNLDKPIMLDHIENFMNTCTRSQILDSDEEVARILKVGDFLDDHCIESMKGETIFFKDGWFIAFDDVEDLVYSIVTKEQFEKMGYVLEGGNNG